MSWSRNYNRPADWHRTRARVLRRDHGICYVCGQPGADQVDHVRPVSQGGAHDDTNLAAIHARPCHAAKTQREQQAGKARRARRRPTRRNPNLID